MNWLMKNMISSIFIYLIRYSSQNIFILRFFNRKNCKKGLNYVHLSRDISIFFILF